MAGRSDHGTRRRRCCINAIELIEQHESGDRLGSVGANLELQWFNEGSGSALRK
jgi:hypothetical protein